MANVVSTTQCQNGAHRSKKCIEMCLIAALVSVICYAILITTKPNNLFSSSVKVQRDRRHTGRRIIWVCSKTDLRIACLIHQWEYVENLKPFEASNFSAPRIRPCIPSCSGTTKREYELHSLQCLQGSFQEERDVQYLDKIRKLHSRTFELSGN